jgi:hypothetical protein
LSSVELEAQLIDIGGKFADTLGEVIHLLGQAIHPVRQPIDAPQHFPLLVHQNFYNTLNPV